MSATSQSLEDLLPDDVESPFELLLENGETRLLAVVCCHTLASKDRCHADHMIASAIGHMLSETDPVGIAKAHAAELICQATRRDEVGRVLWSAVKEHMRLRRVHAGTAPVNELLFDLEDRSRMRFTRVPSVQEDADQWKMRQGGTFGGYYSEEELRDLHREIYPSPKDAS